MFIGHYAVALAAQKAAPRTSLGTLVVATQFLDLLWPVFLLLGVEHVRIAPGNTAFTPLDFYDYPISHSLLTVVGWGIGFALLYWLIKRDRKASLVVGLCVVSHWILDLLTHRPDLPLVPGVDRYVGLGLWNSVAATVMVELLMFGIGVYVFLSCSKAKDTRGRIAFWTLIAFLLLLYAGNVLGGPPPNLTTLAWFGLSQWLLMPWAYWIDRHRVSTIGRQSVAQSA